MRLAPANSNCTGETMSECELTQKGMAKKRTHAMGAEATCDRSQHRAGCHALAFISADPTTAETPHAWNRAALEICMRDESSAFRITRSHQLGSG